MAPESLRRIGHYVEDVRAVLAHRWGDPAGVEWALRQNRVQEMIRDEHRGGSHAGFAAERVHTYIATRRDLEIARRPSPFLSITEKEVA